MSPFSIAALVALALYAGYRQSIRHEVVGATRFKLALIYLAVGVCAGGLQAPESTRAWAALSVSLVLSVVVGIARGRLSKLSGEDGKVWVQGTPLTIGLFVGLIALKFLVGASEALAHVGSPTGFGEVMLMIAAMVAFQAELVWRRALRIAPRLAGAPAGSLT